MVFDNIGESWDCIRKAFTKLGSVVVSWLDFRQAHVGGVSFRFCSYGRVPSRAARSAGLREAELLKCYQLIQTRPGPRAHKPVYYGCSGFATTSSAEPTLALFAFAWSSVGAARFFFSLRYKAKWRFASSDHFLKGADQS